MLALGLGLGIPLGLTTVAAGGLGGYTLWKHKKSQKKDDQAFRAGMERIKESEQSGRYAKYCANRKKQGDNICDIDVCVDNGFANDCQKSVPTTPNFTDAPKMLSEMDAEDDDAPPTRAAPPPPATAPSA